MTTLKEVVLAHLEYTFEKEAWQPSLAMAVDGLTASQAAWRPGPQRHSIWQIVQHVTRWKRAALDDLSGRRPDYDAVERADWRDTSGDDAAWQADVAALREVSAEIKAWVAARSDEDLARTREGESASLAVRIQRMATHDIYHAGQIRYLRALQGA
jgi:uncharacterized damage-inducible protein DinB